MVPLHVILGLAGDGRRGLAADLLGALADEVAPAPVLWLASDAEPACPVAGPRLAAIPSAVTVPWRLAGERLRTAALPDAAAAVMLGPGADDPRPFLEALPSWLAAGDLRLARIHLVLDVGRVGEDPRARRAVDLLLHFADTVLVRRRPETPARVASAFVADLVKEAHPALHASRMPGQEVPLAEWLFPEARRLSTLFDTLQWRPDDAARPIAGNWVIEGSAGALDEDEDEDDEVDPETRAWLARDATGRYQKPW